MASPSRTIDRLPLAGLTDAPLPVQQTRPRRPQIPPAATTSPVTAPLLACEQLRAALNFSLLPAANRPTRPGRGMAPERVRSVFLSDLHLGARASRPDAALDFLAAHEAERIFLVGDILDIWHGGKIHWPAEAEAFMRELDRRAERGVEVIYLSGNHDAALRACDSDLPDSWQHCETMTHTAADGRSYLVLHGDQADSRLMRQHFMTRLGSRLDAMLRGFDDWLGRRFFTRMPDQSTAIQRAIVKFSGLFVMAGRFQNRLVAMAREAGADGVICGHCHRPMLDKIDGTIYANCGDWIDSFTALTEHHDGTLRLVEWGETPHMVPATASFGPVTQDA